MSPFRLACSSLILLLLAAPYLVAGQVPPHWHRGTNFFALDADGFSNRTATGPYTAITWATDGSVFPSLDAANRTRDGLDFIALQWMWRTESATGNSVFPHRGISPPIEDIAAVARYITRVLGLGVLLKPTVVAPDNVQMFELSPSNLTAWFASYGRLLTDTVAAVAAGVPDKSRVTVSVGLELQRISTAAEATPHWHRLINATRSICAECRLTYCSNPLTAETSSIAFWEHLDVIGADFYVPFIISRSPNASAVPPSAAQMRTVYRFIAEKHLFSWYASQVNASASFPKLFLTETGYPSSNFGLQWPFLASANCAPGTVNASNFTAQAAAFENQFEVLTQPPYSDWIVGINQFWFGQPGSADFYGNRHNADSKWSCGWTPVGKEPTREVFHKWFRR